MTLKEKTKAPSFQLPNQSGKSISLKSLLGKWVVLYFYPKDMTPGCTQQACDFTDYKQRYHKCNAVVLGVSKDSLQRHQKFTEKEGITFDLLSDEDGSVCKTYGVFKKKKLYGREFMGIERTTFLINPEGKIEKIYPKVKVKDHVYLVLEDLKNLKQD